ncbi:hypothetical protein [Aminipila terrae]|uniref:Uncharacterized protein n=1 Tax=Aminipila terrae TaxID=2697030 RepID=A0A6P1ME92_9FIRM|nr:hypothetical protein [Aminipila terrae]QHI71453.1 hypothetical protein Ami3637_02825 [Aminipila terrae]
MNIALIDKQTKICENIAVFESMQMAVNMLGEQYIIVEQSDSFGIGDIYKNGEWSKDTHAPQTAEEKQAKYNTLSIQYIHEKYSLDDENKIMREYLLDMNNASYNDAFQAYNVYVEQCKAKAHKEVYGND